MEKINGVNSEGSGYSGCNGNRGSNGLPNRDDGPCGNGLAVNRDIETVEESSPVNTVSNGTDGTSNLASMSERNGMSSARVLKTSSAAASSAHSDDDSEDDYCVYTYKGDLRDRDPQRFADLPSSFYQFDGSDNQTDDSSSVEPSGRFNSSSGRSGFNYPNGIGSGGAHSSNRRNDNLAPNIFSPDMDFLEMDFDPSVYPDADGNDFVSLDGDDIPNLLLQDGSTSNWSESAIDRNSEPSLRPPPANDSPSPSTSNCVCANSVVRKLNSVVLGEDDPHVAPSSEKMSLDKSADAPESRSESRSSGQADNVGDNASNIYPGSTVTAFMSHLDSSTNNLKSENYMLRLVKSNTLPELTSKPVTALSSGSSNFRSSERASILFSSGPVFRDSEPQWSYRARINTSEATSEDSVELELKRVMIWDPTEAKEMAFNQIGVSACGATAVLNVMRALKIEVAPEFVNECVGTRLRAEIADLPQYLFSRSVAGATHSDLISGIRRASADLVVGRFFSVKDMSAAAFSKWILQWICKGAIPVVTRNLQVGSFTGPQDIPDAWHHQMVFGVSPDGLFLNNPMECVPISKILPQLQSESVLLVRRHDILSRKGPNTDLRLLARHSDARWNDMNVLGQVANILLEEIPYFCENTAARRVRSSHIKIPAAYKAGVTLFLLRESPSCNILLNNNVGET